MNATSVDFPAPPADSDVLGEPHVKLVYRGTALPVRTLLYAQILDAAHTRVAGGQVTPIPVILDGRTRTID